ncbi:MULTISPECIES: flagellar hook-length control protein FliK [unclassified Janthinobacterium]|uniref:flagellar hook-length control protein FliK n=1 Tax=unclassified Janthinobacterium TaxID=2610881 RepID=UPI00160AA7EC|nr:MULTISPECIES: flagellar hook-length control protein FliK [unclassified Janthinobacterium]MBB5367466.1 hypothetical protein [Janthinobacterium sp. K2C7]MBB5380056.1 hypothetical protein [Janthinobacterium sp. K2Li3]MBB5385848.1 hypothetical protein [Janthinobacterium sp. K2E3]
MLPKMDAIGMTPLTPVKATRPADTAADPRQADFQRSLQGLVGKSMQGQVLARLTDGSFLVRVAGTPARMQLPAGVQLGAEIPLTLLGINPRPSFQVGAGRDNPGGPMLTYAEAEAEPESATATGAQAGTRTTSTAATLLSRAPLTPANLLPTLGGDTPAPELSTTARAITSVLRQAESAPNTPLALLGKTPLMSGQGQANPAQLAQNLRDAVGSSGLFYESHVAEWAEGKRPLASLLLEPQMQKALQGDIPRSGTDLASAQLINLQLHTHEQARVQWQGEAWAGQQMQWDVTKDAPEGGAHAGADDEEAATWRSGVRFQFPLLGDISAQVVLHGGKVQIQMQAGSADSAETLRRHAAQLEASLDAAGWPLSALSIATKPAEGDEGSGDA